MILYANLSGWKVLSWSLGAYVHGNLLMLCLGELQSHQKVKSENWVKLQLLQKY